MWMVSPFGPSSVPNKIFWNASGIRALPKKKKGKGACLTSRRGLVPGGKTRSFLLFPHWASRLLATARVVVHATETVDVVLHGAPRPFRKQVALCISCRDRLGKTRPSLPLPPNRFPPQIEITLMAFPEMSAPLGIPFGSDSSPGKQNPRRVKVSSKSPTSILRRDSSRDFSTTLLFVPSRSPRSFNDRIGRT